VGIVVREGAEDGVSRSYGEGEQNNEGSYLEGWSESGSGSRSLMPRTLHLKLLSSAGMKHALAENDVQVSSINNTSNGYWKPIMISNR
jgi:hypothetical protein